MKKRSTFLTQVILLCGICMLSAFAAFAQGKVIKGRVTDAKDNTPLPGVTVQVKNTSTGTQTTADGTYSITIPEGNNGILVFTFVGYDPQEIAPGNLNTLNVQLKVAVKALQDVVVIGYGTVKKSDLTGSVGNIKGDVLNQRPAASVNQELSGRVTGVNVSTNSGRPGGRTNLRIRGYTSINTTLNPLYVVDGVILPAGNFDQGTTAIDYINPNDIASIEVLKDASATAIYGVRGANGVVLITTKRGSSAGGRVTYDADFGLSQMARKLKVLNAKEFLAVEDQAYLNAQKYDPTGWAAGKYTDPKLKRNNPLLFDASGNPLYDTDWQKEATQTAFAQNHQVSFTGGNAQDNYGVFLGYRNEDGILRNSYMERYSGRFVFDSQIKDWLKVGGSMSFNWQDENLVDIGTGGLNVTRMMVESLPIIPVKYPSGKWGSNADYPGMEGGENPVNIEQNRIYQLKTQTLLSNVYSNITLAKGLELRSVIGVNIFNQRNDQYASRDLRQISADQKGTSSVVNRRDNFWQFENYLTYNTTFNKDHKLTAMGGVAWQHTDSYSNTASSWNFSDDYFKFNNLGAGSNPQAPASGLSKFAFTSFFGRINYTYKNRYLVTLTGREDGTSKMGNNNKFAFFPSAALGWRVNQENFLKDVSWLSNLKLRTSLGQIGNSEINPYSSLARLGNYTSIFGGIRETGIGNSQLANPALSWERTTQYDAGFELGLFKDRVMIEVDYYNKKTTDMLLNAPVPGSSGYTTIVRNIGAVRNRGFEFALNTVNIQKENFTWSTTFNLSINKNKILALGAAGDDVFPGPGFLTQTNVLRVGESVGSFYGLVRLGTWSEAERDEAAKYPTIGSSAGHALPGDVKYLDVNGDHAYTDADRKIIGKGIPDGYGSFTNTIKFKNFDFLIELQYMYGNDVLNMTRHSAEDRTGQANSYATVLNAWTPTNQNTNIAQLRPIPAGYSTNIDTRWVEDGSFIRGKNIVLGYSFSPETLNKIKLSRLRVYFAAQNVFLITKYTGYDPEVSTYTENFAQGIQFFDYPKPRTFMLGVNVGF
ncbi:TonB-linked SusC/RagA family outer membrane protein [Chitinophaga skermanii]|uniref:TonB-linked SusC/RagA family outer membrane protein n=1 Tax=Chitinophaga skermanii TaxID=331697 RepID=A0A327R369_9BACT|nr:TonB-dependent receptor [Chitinophaga skermanii]RAJ10665.1 TonB-linked SusC/RagA family outer membrane protein [Chitinophaga skermanii]